MGSIRSIIASDERLHAVYDQASAQRLREVYEHISAGRLHKVSDQIVCTVHSLNEHGAVLIEKSIDMVSDQRLHEVY